MSKEELGDASERRDRKRRSRTMIPQAHYLHLPRVSRGS